MTGKKWRRTFSDWGLVMTEDPFVFLAVATVWACVIGSIMGGLFILSRWWWARVAWREQLATERLDLYRVAQYVGLHRAKNCGCPMCGGPSGYSYGDQFLTDWSDDVG